MALQCLPNFFSQSARQLREEGVIDHTFLIFVATSGETGKAALEGFKDKDGIRHRGHVSRWRRERYPVASSMATHEGSDVDVWAVSGNFDDCQTGSEPRLRSTMRSTKRSCQPAEGGAFKRELDQLGTLASAGGVLHLNLCPTCEKGKVNAGDPIDVCVPTGNFGNILAAWYAKQMGTPIDMLFCASNENKVLTDFIASGTYDIADRAFVLTPSPSMDILVSSNVERQLFELSGRKSELIAEWMREL